VTIPIPGKRLIEGAIADVHGLFQKNTLQFANWIDPLFEPVGTNGCPDPSVDPMGCYQYLSNRRKVIQGQANQTPLIRLADKNMELLCALTGELQCTYEELMTDSAQLTCTIRYTHWLEDFIVNGLSINEDLHILVDPIPTNPSYKTRWGGKCKEISISNNPDGSSTITFMALSHREHMKKLLFGANPFFPPEVQLPKMWVLGGPLRSLLFATGFVNLARLFVPGLSFVTNVFNPASWLNPLNPDALLNVNPLNWPIQVAFVNPAIDTSMWSVLAATWTDWHSTTSDLLSQAGCIARAYTYLKTDPVSPHTELSHLIQGLTEGVVDLISLFGVGSGKELHQLVKSAGKDLDSLTAPNRNCVIISFEDKSGIVGPTGTALDGLDKLVGATLDDMITSVIFDQQSTTFVNGEQVIDVNAVTPFFQTLLGVQQTQPKVIWRDGQFTGMLQRKVNMHKGPPKTIMTGGRSPSIVNQLQTFGIRYALAELSDLLTLGIVVGLGVGDFTSQIPATPGLDNIYQGQLDNSLFAWERYTDPLRALWTGEAAYQEYIERGSSSAYTLAGWLSLSEGHWKTRAFYGFETKALNGRPWVYGVDFQLGDRLGFEMDSVIFVDQFTSARYQYDRKMPVFLEISIGDDKDKHDPVAQGIRILSGVYALVGAYLGEGTLFG
jgi:hypothetical protein